jgi:hypothetical protein
MGIASILVICLLFMTTSCKEPILPEQHAAAVPTTLRRTSVSKLCNLSKISDPPATTSDRYPILPAENVFPHRELFVALTNLSIVVEEDLSLLRTKPRFLVPLI